MKPQQVTKDWIKNQMKVHNIRSVDIVRESGIDKCTMSSLINGKKNLGKWHKVAFFYYFKNK